VIPAANVLDWEPYDGPTEDLVGTLEVRTVGDGEIVPEHAQYLVGGRLADPATIKREPIRAAGLPPMADKGAQRHDPRTGRYVPKAGGSGGSAAKSGGSATKATKVAKKVAPKVPKKDSGLTVEAKREKQLAQLAEARRIAAEKRAAGTIKQREPKAKNPKVLTDDVTLRYQRNWSEEFHQDTGWEKPVPVRHFTVIPAGAVRNEDGTFTATPPYVVEHGHLFRVDGKIHLVEISDASSHGLEAAKEIAQHQHEMFHRAVPKSLQRHQDGFVYLKGRNPQDAYWAKRYGVSGFESNAIGGDGLTTIFGGAGHTASFTQGSMLHELGHNIDYASGYRNRLSDRLDWGASTSRDTSHSMDVLTGPGVRRTSIYSGHPATPGAKAVTTYGMNAPVEDFAESVRMYLTDISGPAQFQTHDGRDLRFRDIWPSRYAFLRDQLGVDYR